MRDGPHCSLQGRALEGPVYAAAKKAAHMQPLNPAAHNVLGLTSGEPGRSGLSRRGRYLLHLREVHPSVLITSSSSHVAPPVHTHAEARGDYAGAVASYRRALRLLLGAAHDPDAALRHPPTAAAAAGVAASLQTAVQLNLARALVGAGSGGAAGQLYEELEATAGGSLPPGVGPTGTACAGGGCARQAGASGGQAGVDARKLLLQHHAQAFTSRPTTSSTARHPSLQSCMTNRLHG